MLPAQPSPCPFSLSLQDTPVALSPETRQSLSTPSESETLTITTRVEAVMALTTRVVFFDVCRALFGKDKLLLAFMIAVALHTYDMIESGQIRPAVLSTSGAGTAGNAALPELHLLLHGPSAGKVATEDSDAESRSLMPSASLLRELEGDSGDQTATPVTSRSFVSSASIGSSSTMLVLSSSGRMLLAQAGSLVPAMRGILEHVQVCGPAACVWYNGCRFTPPRLCSRTCTTGASGSRSCLRRTRRCPRPTPCR